MQKILFEFPYPRRIRPINNLFLVALLIGFYFSFSFVLHRLPKDFFRFAAQSPMSNDDLNTIIALFVVSSICLSLFGMVLVHLYFYTKGFTWKITAKDETLVLSIIGFLSKGERKLMRSELETIAIRRNKLSLELKTGERIPVAIVRIQDLEHVQASLNEFLLN